MLLVRYPIARAKQSPAHIYPDKQITFKPNTCSWNRTAADCSLFVRDGNLCLNMTEPGVTQTGPYLSRLGIGFDWNDGWKMLLPVHTFYFISQEKSILGLLGFGLRSAWTEMWKLSTLHQSSGQFSGHYWTFLCAMVLSLLLQGASDICEKSWNAYTQGMYQLPTPPHPLSLVVVWSCGHRAAVFMSAPGTCQPSSCTWCLWKVCTSHRTCPVDSPSALLKHRNANHFSAHMVWWAHHLEFLDKNRSGLNVWGWLRVMMFKMRAFQRDLIRLQQLHEVSAWGFYTAWIQHQQRRASDIPKKINLVKSENPMWSFST